MKKAVLVMLSVWIFVGMGCVTTLPNDTDQANTFMPSTKNASNFQNFEATNLTSVPQSIFDKTNTVELNVSYNNLTGSLPAEVRQLKNLKVLNLSHNQMTGVPAEIGQLSGLEVLDLSYNQLTGLPYELGNLQNLKTLVLTGNAYSEADLAIIMKSLPSGVNIIR